MAGRHAVRRGWARRREAARVQGLPADRRAAVRGGGRGARGVRRGRPVPRLGRPEPPRVDAL
ncbi:hypothetical protein ADJ70_08555 [Olsenella sp. oral taxon 807]|nr:hypothetical protein ADJ70_08555 [Olsenella sp. oral taxon 807]